MGIEADQLGKTILMYPINVVGQVITQDVEEANRTGELPPFIVACPDPDDEKNRTLVFHHPGFSLKALEQKAQKILNAETIRK